MGHCLPEGYHAPSAPVCRVAVCMEFRTPHQNAKPRCTRAGSANRGVERRVAYDPSDAGCDPDSGQETPDAVEARFGALTVSEGEPVHDDRLPSASIYHEPPYLAAQDLAEVQ